MGWGGMEWWWGVVWWGGAGWVGWVGVGLKWGAGVPKRIFGVRLDPGEYLLFWGPAGSQKGFWGSGWSPNMFFCWGPAGVPNLQREPETDFGGDLEVSLGGIPGGKPQHTVLGSGWSFGALLQESPKKHFWVPAGPQRVPFFRALQGPRWDFWGPAGLQRWICFFGPAAGSGKHIFGVRDPPKVVFGALQRLTKKQNQKLQ